MDLEKNKLLEYAVEITKAYYGNSTLSANGFEVTQLLEQVYDKLVELAEKS